MGSKLKALIVLVAIAWLGWTAHSASAIDYPPLKLSYLIGTADAIVQVKLPQTLTNPFKSEVEIPIVGEMAKEQLTVCRTTKWQSRQETPDPSLSQEAILFLKRSSPPSASDENASHSCHLFNRGTATNTGDWQILGPSAEGLLWVQNDYLYFQGINIPSAEWEWYSLSNSQIYAQRFHRATFVSAVTDFDSCVNWRVQPNKNPLPSFNCDEATLSRLAGKSELHKQLIEEAKAAQVRERKAHKKG